MSFKMRRRIIAVLFTLPLTSLLWAGQAHAQTQGQCRGRQQMTLQQTNPLLSALQQPTLSSSQTALQQQQNNLQTALLQTTALVNALQQQPSLTANQSALLAALQQQQANLQTASQLTNTALTGLQQQNGQLTASQLQTLRQQQIALLRQVRNRR
jgi:hypothetical protein